MLSESLDTAEFEFLFAFVFKIVGSVYYLWDSQVRNLAKSTLKLGPTALFTHLKIILL